MSIFSYPDRGPWGKSSWRGNASGWFYKDIFTWLKPRLFVDPMKGSGTSIEVAQEMQIEAVGLDLHEGFDILRDSILTRVGRPADLVLSHPPYGACIVYSGAVWGTEPHPSDLSRCADDDDFCEKLQAAMLNQREATSGGGHYGILIGDWRRGGKYTSYQAEMVARMPRDELAGIIIKGQHNCMSDRKQYGHMALPRITHEYLLLFKRPRTILSMLDTLRIIAKQQSNSLRGTWRSIVRMALISLGGQATLKELYDVIAAGCDRAASSPNYQAKVRQIVQLYNEFERVDKGVWKLA